MNVVGMGTDLSAFLAVLGALIDSGDLMAWSMGGTPPPGVGSPLAQRGTGLTGRFVTLGSSHATMNMKLTVVEQSQQV